MKKNIRYLIAIIIALVTIYTTNQSPQITNTISTTVNQTNHAIFYLDDLKETENFNANALEHIFHGTINRNGDATGFHFEKTGQEAEIVEETRSKKDRHGVYRADITIKGIKKSGYSSFFPEEWSPQEVVDAINEAYDHREYISGNTYEGESHHGISIQMYLTDNNKIISAFPIYER